MSDNTAVVEKKEGVLQSAGKPVAGEFPGFKKPDAEKQATNTTTTTNPPAVDDKTKNPPAPNVADKDKKTDPPPEFNEDNLKAYLKKEGIDFNGSIGDLKKKLTAKESTAELTAEEKEAKVQEKEKRLFDLHIGRKGTPEQWVELKKLAAGDPKEIGIAKFKNDLKAEGFPVEQMDALIKKMHLDISDEELELLDKDEQDLIKKERAFGAKKLANRGLYIQNTAKGYFDELNSELTEKETEAALKIQHASNVEDAISKFQRNQKIELGKVDDVEIQPLELEIPDPVLAQVKELTSDRSKLESKIFNKDGTVNLDFLLPHLINSFSYNSAIKTALLEGQTRQVAIYEKTFGKKPPPLGGTGNSNGEKGKLVAAGKPVYADPKRK